MTRWWIHRLGVRQETTKVITVQSDEWPQSSPDYYTLRYWWSGRCWLAAVYRGYATDSGAMVAGTTSRHTSAKAAQRRLLAWVRAEKRRRRGQ